MRRIVYLSSARTALDKEQVEEILHLSRRNNQEAGITGFLAYHDGCFFQVIEGPDVAIERALTRIRLDTRHSGMLVLSDTDAEHRAFPDWRMAFVARSELAGVMDKAAIPLADIARQASSLSDDMRVNKLFKSFLASFRDLTAS
ncbi:BLUF domain-containing protein [Roseinatronobacter sp.]|uniref:BLUF domain-containing protein n=1 Tax=Roseinatronobacter sp. TaxID=1945755 RepID=UPI003F71941C